jgi:hypothetical protein
MIFERQKLLLALLAANGGSLDRVDFQKLLFLYMHTCETEPSYEFVPFKKGCYSFTSLADKDKLTDRGLLVQGEDWLLTAAGLKASRVAIGLQGKLKTFSDRRRNLRGAPLVANTYREYPYWATRSNLASTILKDEPQALAAIERVRPAKVKAMLCSIGYEGRTLEGYMNALLKAGVTVLCDVRRNPLSRKFGFSKKMLSHVCSEMGIRYEHLPELGIASDERQELNDLSDYQALFAKYEQTVLLNAPQALTKIANWIIEGECVALTCYERLPEYCHRTRVANAVERRINSIANHL